MARIIVFNNDTNRIENYYRNENEAMPYNANRSLTPTLVKVLLKNDECFANVGKAFKNTFSAYFNFIQ